MKEKTTHTTYNKYKGRIISKPPQTSPPHPLTASPLLAPLLRPAGAALPGRTDGGTGAPGSPRRGRESGAEAAAGAGATSVKQVKEAK